MPQLYFTRFIFAAFIVIFHFGKNISIFDNVTMKYFLSLAPAVVNYFFILSGFVLTSVYDKISLDKNKFYLKRFLHIYPSYIIALLILIVFFLWTGQAVNIKAFFVQALLLQAWIPTFSNVLNTPSWAVSVEIFFYACFPFVLINLKRINRKWLLGVIGLSLWFISVVIYQYYSKDFLTSNFSYTYVNPLLCLNFFIIGIISYLLFIKNIQPKSNRSSNILLFISVIVVIILIIIRLPWLYYGNFAILTPLFIIFLIGLANNNTSIAKIFSNKTLVLLGKISYEIYIFQVPVFVWWSFGFNNLLLKYPNLSYLHHIYFFGFFINLIFIAWLSYLFIEKPVQNTIKNKKS